MKKLISIAIVLALVLSMTGCGAASSQPATVPETTQPAVTQVTQEPTTEATQPAPEGMQLTVYSMKGPTSMGLVKLMQDSAAGLSFNTYDCQMVTAADQVTAAIVSQDADIAMLPANAAAALYNKAGGFSVVAINTLGVLYLVENGETIQDFTDLSGKTVYLTGKGTTPEYAMTYLMAQYGVTDVTLEFKSEAAEVVTALAADAAAIGVLPQPFATSALMQNESLRIALSLTDCWAQVAPDSAMVTGVTLVRTEILEQYGPQIAAFLEEYAASVSYVNANPGEAAQWIQELGIVGKAAIAEKALPLCNLVCITGQEMQTRLGGYLQTLFDANPNAVGGAMPDDGFYLLSLPEA